MKLVQEYMVPAMAGPCGRQRGTPVVQSTAPRSQGVPVEHAWPGVHVELQLPVASQKPVAHMVPTGWNTCTGHSVATPLQTSATSQLLAAARRHGVAPEHLVIASRPASPR